MKTASKKNLYEISRLNYLLENKKREISLLRDELKGISEINSLCSAFIMYFIESCCTEVDGVFSTRIPKDKISSFVGKYYAKCAADGTDYTVSLYPRESGEPLNEKESTEC